MPFTSLEKDVQPSSGMESRSGSREYRNLHADLYISAEYCVWGQLYLSISAYLKHLYLQGLAQPLEFRNLVNNS